jgi:hypothetical protein
MIKAEADKVQEMVFKMVEESTVRASQFGSFCVAIQSMTHDTDPRLAMLDELEYSYKLDPNCVIETIDYFRDKIKQEAGDENNSNGE